MGQVEQQFDAQLADIPLQPFSPAKAANAQQRNIRSRFGAQRPNALSLRVRGGRTHQRRCSQAEGSIGVC